MWAGSAYAGSWPGAKTGSVPGAGFTISPPPAAASNTRADEGPPPDVASNATVTTHSDTSKIL